MKPEQLRERRLKLGMTQQEFGEKLGFSKKWARMRVSELELGKKTITQKTALLCGLIKKRRKV